MSGKRIAIIVIPIAAVAIIIAGIFAFPSQLLPDQDLAGSSNSDSNTDNGTQLVPASCTDVTARVRNIVSLDAQAMDETRVGAADVLVEEYCQRPELVQEIGTMSSPAIVLVAYACDAGSGRLGDTALQSSLKANSQLYCDNAFIVIFEESEQIVNAAETFMDDLLQESESGDPDVVNDNSTATDADVAENQAKLEEISDYAKQAKSQLRADKYYEAAKSLDSASKLAEALSES